MPSLWGAGTLSLPAAGDTLVLRAKGLHDEIEAANRADTDGLEGLLTWAHKGKFLYLRRVETAGRLFRSVHFFPSFPR